MKSIIRFVQTADAVYLVLLAGIVAQLFATPATGYLTAHWVTLNVALVFVALVSAGIYVAVKTKLEYRKAAAATSK